MARFTQTTSSNRAREQLQFRLKYHPMRVIIYLLLVAISSAFLFLTLSYFLTTIGTSFNKFKLPLLFHANSIIILVSSYSIAQTRNAMLRDDEKSYLGGLLVTLGLGVAFTVFQVAGWRELLRSGISFTNNIAGTYLYVISGLHLLHLLIGVALMGYFLVQAVDRMNDPVKVLMFESDPFSKMKVDILCVYWHFVDGLWLYLYIFFLLNIYVFTEDFFKPISG